MSHRMPAALAGKVALGLVLACVMSVAAHAQPATPPAKTAQPATPPAKTAPPATSSARAATQHKAEDVLPLTCAQAWVQAGKGYPGMLAIMQTLARVSLANRDLTFPNTREAGQDVGRGIAEDCKADPNGLLFAFVDKHVRRVVEAAARPGQ